MKIILASVVALMLATTAFIVEASGADRATTDRIVGRDGGQHPAHHQNR